VSGVPSAPVENALALIAVAPNVPVASMAPLLTVTAELAIEPLTTSAPALTVVGPLDGNAPLTTLHVMDLLVPPLPRSKGAPSDLLGNRLSSSARLGSRFRWSPALSGLAVDHDWIGKPLA
jgi:hypothetical protein